VALAGVAPARDRIAVAGGGLGAGGVLKYADVGAEPSLQSREVRWQERAARWIWHRLGRFAPVGARSRGCSGRRGRHKRRGRFAPIAHWWRGTRTGREAERNDEQTAKVDE